MLQEVLVQSGRGAPVFQSGYRRKNPVVGNIGYLHKYLIFLACHPHEEG